jgi:hypothetical protein
MGGFDVPDLIIATPDDGGQVTIKMRHGRHSANELFGAEKNAKRGIHAFGFAGCG